MMMKSRLFPLAIRSALARTTTLTAAAASASASRHLRHSIPQFSFSTKALSASITLPNGVNYKNPFKIIMTRKNEDTIELEVLFANQEEQNVTVLQTDAQGTIGDLLDGLRERYKLGGDLNAFSLDKQQLSETILLDDLEGSNFYIADSKDEKLFFLVENEDIEIKNEYQQIDTYCQDISLSYLEKQVIINYLKRVDNIAAIKHNTEIFSDSVLPNPALANAPEQQRTLINKANLIQTMIQALPQNRNLNTEFEVQLIQKYEQLQKNFAQLSEVKEQIDLVGHKKVKRNMSLGLFALIGQFAFVGAGTYHIWSWDIVEPMAYFMTSAGVIFLNTHFFKYFNDYSNEGYYAYLKKKQTEKLYAKYNFDHAQYLAVQQEILQIERTLKSNLLVNF